jgi:hypothetical protein
LFIIAAFAPPPGTDAARARKPVASCARAEEAGRGADPRIVNCIAPEEPIYITFGRTGKVSIGNVILDSNVRSFWAFVELAHVRHV